MFRRKTDNEKQLELMIEIDRFRGELNLVLKELVAFQAMKIQMLETMLQEVKNK